MLYWSDENDFINKTQHLPNIHILETMATFSCTLACKFCTNYSDYNMRGGYVKWDQMQIWLDKLFSRLTVDNFHIIGGEPFLNPELKLWVNSFKERYPYIRLKVVTNGTLLKSNWWILDSMTKYNKLILEISNHQPDLNYVNEAKDKILNHFKWELEYSNHYATQWNSYENDLNFIISNNSHFLKTYKNDYGNMKPYNNNPAQAFDICVQQQCPLLVDGKLFKCSTVGLLDRVLKDHNQLNDPDWQEFLNTGLSIDCTNDELSQYVSNYGKPNAICKMCPVLADEPYQRHTSTFKSSFKLD